jgi:hypothetical protein
MNQRGILIIDQKLVKGNLVSWNKARYSIYTVIYFRDIDLDIFVSLEGSANFFRQWWEVISKMKDKRISYLPENILQRYPPP